MDKIKFTNLLEKWNPRNKKKHKESKDSVRSFKRSFPTVDSKKKQIHDYYNEEENMEHLIRLVERKIDLTEEKKERQNGSPWFLDKETRKTTKVQVSRGDTAKRSFMSKSQQSARKRIGTKIIAKFLAKGGKLSAKAPNNPAKTMKEVLWARATMMALDGHSGRGKKKSKKKTKKSTSKK